jgi:hypothetical protein
VNVVILGFGPDWDLLHCGKASEIFGVSVWITLVMLDYLHVILQKLQNSPSLSEKENRG